MPEEPEKPPMPGVDMDQLARTPEVKRPTALNIVLGLWLMASPFILGYSDLRPLMLNNVLIGSGIVVVAILRRGPARQQSWLSWLNVAFGIWLVVAPFVILPGKAAPNAGFNERIIALLVVLTGLWSVAAYTRPLRGKARKRHE